MNDAGQDQEVSPSRELIVIAIEAWRMSRLLSDPKADHRQASVMKYSVSKIRETLESAGITWEDLTGQSYETGLAVDILDVEGTKSSDSDTQVIVEMVEPIILFGGKLLRHGKAVTEWSKGSTDSQEGGTR